MPNNKASRPAKYENDFYQRIDATVADVAEIRRARLSREYDGVLGTPPRWFTTDTQNSFFEARNRLLDEGGFDKKGYTPEKLYSLIVKVIEEDKEAIAHPKRALNRDTFLVPPRDRENIYTLAGLWKLYQQGENKGTPLLLGDFLQSRVEQGQKYSAHQARNAKKLRGRVGDGKTRMNDLVRRVVRSHPDDSAKELWSRFPNVLRDYQLDPEWVGDDIEYSFKDERKRLKLSRFKNMVSAIRTNNSR
jgi:hypothetical protein